ncbi:MAG: hypothetical protein O3C63_02670 [Cyanobacteria bacterium]|nr:hypothetical protein [Cyanobacteriota bacterium]MDA1020090.1 hypothetical protein [Cyanobacteriota bacterium]
MTDKLKSVSIIFLISALVWSSSLTNEFTGYDDIKLIVENKHLEQGILHCLSFFWNTFSGSFNTAWADFPTVIYRPLEQYMIAIGYQIWGTSAWHYHFFFNYLVHIINSVLVFFIISKFITKQKLALIITCLWTVHPLGHEAINMLTSGAGFLVAHCLFFIAILIMLYSSNLFAILFSAAIFFLSYLGSEMAILATPILAILLKGDSHYWRKLSLVSASFLAYLIQRSSIIQNNIEFTDLAERILVLAPQTFVHQLKQVIYPNNLSIDQQHNMILGDVFSLVHTVSILISILVITVIVYFYQKNKQISATIAIAAISISLALNIVPLYTLARDRYTYIFSLCIITALVLITDKYIKTKYKYLLAIPLIVTMGNKSWQQSLNWKNGETLWSQTITNTKDIGAKQVWRYRLLQYYDKPGTQSFKADPIIQKQITLDFNNFIIDNNLHKKETILAYNTKNKSIKNKYSYNDNKSIASGIFSQAMLLKKQKEFERMITLLNLAYFYHPDHYQNNMQLYVWDKSRSEQVFPKILRDAKKHPILAKSLLDSMLILKDPKYPKLVNELTSNFQSSHIFKEHLNNVQ